MAADSSTMSSDHEARFRLIDLKQEEGQDISEYIQDKLNLAEDCNFCNKRCKDAAILSAILAGMKDTNWRNALLQKPLLSISDLLSSSSDELDDTEYEPPSKANRKNVKLKEKGKSTRKRASLSIKSYDTHERFDELLKLCNQKYQETCQQDALFFPNFQSLLQKKPSHLTFSEINEVIQTVRNNIERYHSNIYRYYLVGASLQLLKHALTPKKWSERVVDIFDVEGTERSIYRYLQVFKLFQESKPFFGYSKLKFLILPINTFLSLDFRNKFINLPQDMKSYWQD